MRQPRTDGRYFLSEDIRVGIVSKERVRATFFLLFYKTAIVHTIVGFEHPISKEKNLLSGQSRHRTSHKHNLVRWRHYFCVHYNCVIHEYQIKKIMLKNITLSADQKLLQLAREKATKENSTLNAQFRAWLERYVSTDRRLINYDGLMEQFDYAQPGRTFSRDDMNER